MNVNNVVMLELNEKRSFKCFCLAQFCILCSVFKCFAEHTILKTLPPTCVQSGSMQQCQYVGYQEREKKERGEKKRAQY